MASPQIVVFALFDSSFVPLTLQSPTFSAYKDETGANLTQPVITEIGGGLYKFTPTFTANHGIAYMIDGGVNTSPRYQFNWVRPEDFNEDLISGISTTLNAAPAAVWDQLRSSHVTAGTFGELMRLLKQILSGHVKVDPNVGTETVFQEDNVTALQTSTLKDKNGAAAGLNATERLAAV